MSHSNRLAVIFFKQSHLCWLFVISSFFAGPLAVSAEMEDLSAAKNEFLVAEGYGKLKSGQVDEALLAFNEVLERDVGNLNARLGQAMIFADQERHKEAFVAYDQIIQQDPQHFDAWNGRGLAAFNMENFDEALASFKKAVVDQPVNGFFYESIAWTQMCRGDYGKAAESAKKALLMYDRKGEVSLYPLLIAYFSYHESGDTENALSVLQYASRNKRSDKWPAPVIDYLNRKIDESVLISFVSNRSEETEAHTYIGLHMRLMGEMETAHRHLNWVSQQGDSQVFEYTLAKTFKLQTDFVSLAN